MRPRHPASPWLFLAPTLALLFVFFVLPLGIAAMHSFERWDLLTPPRWIGTKNYADLASSGELVAILGRTLGYSAAVVVPSVTLGLALAVALDRPGRLYAFVRGSVFSAYVVSWVAVALLWMSMLDEGGPLATIVKHVAPLRWSLRQLGMPTSGWLGDPRSALLALAGVSVWKITGYSMVVFLAGLQDIPPVLLDAAALDGARPAQRFWHVTWPLLRPSAAFVATTSLILSFQAFDVVRVMTQGGPIKSTTLFVYAIYEQVFVDLRVGRASALTVVFFVLLLAMTGLQLWAWRRASPSAARRPA